MNSKKILILIMAVAAALMCFTGCAAEEESYYDDVYTEEYAYDDSSEDIYTDSTDGSSNEDSDVSDDTSNDTSAISNDEILKVTAIEDVGFTAILYESGSYVIEDYLNIDTSSYTATETEKTIDVSSTVDIFAVIDGELVDIAFGDIIAGDMLAVTYDSDTQELIQIIDISITSTVSDETDDSSSEEAE